MLATTSNQARRYIAPNDPQYDTDEDAARDDLVASIASHEWKAHIGDGPMLGSMVCDGLAEVLSDLANSTEQMNALGVAHAAGAQAFGEFLHPMVEAFWRKWCTDKAEGYVSLMEREAQDEAAAARTRD